MNLALSRGWFTQRIAGNAGKLGQNGQEGFVFMRKVGKSKGRDATGPVRQSGDGRRPASGVLRRETFRTSRLLDFCSHKELIAQTGHRPDAWPLVLLKELVDNALDACEDAGV